MGSALLNVQIFGTRFWASETSAPVLVDEAGASVLALKSLKMYTHTHTHTQKLTHFDLRCLN